MYKVEFRDGKAIRWDRTRNGAEKAVQEYSPAFHVEADDPLEARVEAAGLDPVRATALERMYTSPGADTRSRVVRIETVPGRLREAANRLKKRFNRFRLRFYGVDLEPQHRFCLQEGFCPRPKYELRSMELSLPRKSLGNDDLSELGIDGKRFGSERRALEHLRFELKERDPDLLKVNRGELLPLLGDRMELGREGGTEKLAGENTVSSYGKTVHSAARYDVSGRAVIDLSNSFLHDEAGMDGMWEMVERSWKPIQEVSWASIGNVLTSIEVRKAREKDVLTPWRNWNPETPLSGNVFHAADRGGFIFSPRPGIVEDVHECDFSSMYPNIMVEHNISPETVDCSCCEGADVPELGFSVCEEHGFIPEVLWKLVADRQRWKHELEEATGEEAEQLESKIDGLKWLLVSCYGYMGHAHASYGAIECHQAINAYARELLRDAKERFEQDGWKVEHGIIDSLWASRGENAGDVHEICSRVTSDSGIELEHERRFEWCAFVPRKSSEASIGTLNRYFGFSDGELVAAGIETEQRSTPQMVREAQEKMIRALDRHMDASSIMEVLEDEVERLESGEVAAEDLVIRKTASKNLEQYENQNRTSAAIRRARLNGFDVRAGQDVRYVVRDDSAPPAGRVRLDFEAESYDEEFYRELLVRAAETVVSPMGHDRSDVRQRLKGYSRESLAGY